MVRVKAGHCLLVVTELVTSWLMLNIENDDMVLVTLSGLGDLKFCGCSYGKYLSSLLVHVVFRDPYKEKV